MSPTPDGHDLWSADRIACPLPVHDRTAAIRDLAGRLASAPGVVDAHALLAAIETREAQASTYLGGGVAMPHARSDAVNRLAVAVGLAPRGIDWGVPRELARLIFLVGVPRDTDRDYLEMLRAITQAVRRLEWIEQAVACRDAAALLAHLQATISLPAPLKP